MQLLFDPLLTSTLVLLLLHSVGVTCYPSPALVSTETEVCNFKPQWAGASGGRDKLLTLDVYKLQVVQAGMLWGVSSCSLLSLLLWNPLRE